MLHVKIEELYGVRHDLFSHMIAHAALLLPKFLEDRGSNDPFEFSRLLFEFW